MPGKQLKLTIDLDLQIAAEQALEGRNGSIVAMDPRNGEILAMVSRPTFDPNNFSIRISRDEWTKLVNDPDHPLLNKAIQAQLAPGSVFKIIMATAGLQEGIAQDMKVTCNGGASFYGRYFKCWVVAEHRRRPRRRHHRTDAERVRAEQVGLQRHDRLVPGGDRGDRLHAEIPCACRRSGT